MVGAATVARRIARVEDRDVLAHHVLETLLAGLAIAPFSPRQSPLESALRAASHAHAALRLGAWTHR
jgi:hypothetical protein